jgi:hypothetical protein
MQEPDRLIGCSDFPELEFVEREATPEPAMKLGIQLYLRDYRCRIPSLSSPTWVSIGVALLFTTGFRRLIYSQQGVTIRITSRLMRP